MRGRSASSWADAIAEASEFIAGLKAQAAELANENELLRSHVTALSTAAASGHNISAAAAASAALALGPRSSITRGGVSEGRRASFADEMDASRAELDRTPLAAPTEPWPGAQQHMFHQPQTFYPEPVPHQPPPSRPPAAQPERQVSGRGRRQSAMQTSGSEEDYAESGARPSADSR